MIAEFTRMSTELDREIATEEQRANISDPNHFAYPTYARAARTRRDNIVASLTELRGQLEEAEAQLKEANDELAKTQSQEARDRGGPERMIEVVAERRPVEIPQAFRR
jgi:chromosome segregation ATPase